VEHKCESTIVIIAYTVFITQSDIMAAVPTVPATEITALAFLAEHPEMDIVLTLYGFE
jgi:hypothetical protein